MEQRHGCLESSILNVLWELEGKNIYTNSVKDVFDYLSKTGDCKRAYTTIKTVMDRLVKKKILLKYRNNNKYCYRTAYSNMDIISDSLKLIAKRYCDGDYKKLSSILDKIVCSECIAVK